MKEISQSDLLNLYRESPEKALDLVLSIGEASLYRGALLW